MNRDPLRDRRPFYRVPGRLRWESGPDLGDRVPEKGGATVRESKVTPTFAQTGVEHAALVTIDGKDALLLFAKNGILANQAEEQLLALVEQLSGSGSTGDLPVRRRATSSSAGWTRRRPAATS